MAAYRLARKELMTGSRIVRSSGNAFKTIVDDITFNLQGAGFSYSLKWGIIPWRVTANRVKAVFKMNAAGDDYYLKTMFPIR